MTSVINPAALPRLVAPAVPGGEAAPLEAPSTFSNASLYVGDLQSDVVESNLFELFSSVGSVASIRICRDNVTRRSLGYGYVNFHNADDAARAIDILNYEKIKGRQCRIMWSQRDPTLRKTGVGNVFVKNLDAAIDMQTLNDTFSKFGNILSCKVSTNKDGVSKGYGFVHFDSDEAASNAIKNANGTLLLGKIITVEHYIRRTDRRVTSDWTNIYIKNFPLDWTEEQIRELFGKYGTITSLVLRTNEATGENLGFGFINYDSHEAAKDAVEALHNFKVGVEVVPTPVEGPDGVATGETVDVSRDKLLFVQKHQKKAERESQKIEQAKVEQAKKIEKYAGRNLYVRNFDDTVDEQRLMTEFKEYGTISSCVIMRSPAGVSKGYGFVCYSSPEEATRAVTQLNGKMLDRKPIYVALAQRKDQRKMQLEQQRRQAQMRNGMVMGGPMGYSGLPMGAYPANFARGPMPQQYMNQQYMAMAGPRPTPFNNVNHFGGPRGGIGGGRGRGNSRGARGGSRGGFGGPVGYGPSGGRPMAPMPPMAGPTVSAPVMNPRSVPLTPQALANASEEQRTNMIGERLFPLVASQHPEHASKITGMLLEMEISDLLHLLESPMALTEKIQEALEVLLSHQAAAERS